MDYFPFDLKPPVLILSSSAGSGNERIAEALRIRLQLPDGCHHSIESLIGAGLRKKHFDRHRFLCRRFPAALFWVYGFAPAYPLKMRSEKNNPAVLKELGGLESLINEWRIQTIVAANHRAAFWVAILKQKRRISAGIYGLATDFALSPGWIHNLWEHIDGFVSPVRPERLPRHLARKLKVAPMATHPDFDVPSASPRNAILVAGGGWGLGPIESVVRRLRGALPSAALHIACGANTELLKRLTNEHRHSSRIRIYGLLPSLAPLIRQVGAVILRPGASTLAEARASGKKIFLLPGLPVIEAANARFARENFGAEPYSISRVRDWAEVSPPESSVQRPDGTSDLRQK